MNYLLTKVFPAAATHFSKLLSVLRNPVGIVSPATSCSSSVKLTAKAYPDADLVLLLTLRRTDWNWKFDKKKKIHFLFN